MLTSFFLAFFLSKIFKLTYSRMEGDGRHKIDMLETTETLFTGYVPKSNRLIHRRGQNKIILREERFVIR